VLNWNIPKVTRDRASDRHAGGDLEVRAIRSRLKDKGVNDERPSSTYTLVSVLGRAAKGVAEMNRAVELEPNSVRVRLTRAFNGLNLPGALRNNAAEAEDLDFIISVAEGSRQGDYLHIIRGGLYFELGKLDLAKSQYEMAGEGASPAATEANTRLNALTQGGVAASDIKKLRSAAGANCAMCHGK
jgi:hypothetical protein